LLLMQIYNDLFLFKQYQGRNCSSFP